MNEYKNMRIAVAGTGYVGMSIATLLAQHHRVIACLLYTSPSPRD